MFNIFRKTPRKTEITTLNDFEKAVFTSWKISQPSSAQRVRLRLGLWVSASVLIPEHVGEAADYIVPILDERLIEQSRSLRLSLESLCAVEVPDYLVDFSVESVVESCNRQVGPGVTLQTQLDGATALLVLAELYGDQAREWLADRNGFMGAESLLMRGFAIGGEDKSDAMNWVDRRAQLTAIFGVLTTPS